MPETFAQFIKDQDRLLRENELLAAENASLRRSRALALAQAVRRLLGLRHM